MKITIKPFWGILLTSLVVLLGVEAVLARWDRGGDETYFDYVACTDGLIARIAFDPPGAAPTEAILEGTLIMDSSTILTDTLPVVSSPIVITDSHGITRTMPYQVEGTLDWDSVLLSGDRLIIETTGGSGLNESTSQYLTVQDCTLSQPPVERDSVILVATVGSLTIPAGGPECSPVLNSTISVVATEGLDLELFNKPVADINVSMFIRDWHPVSRNRPANPLLSATNGSVGQIPEAIETPSVWIPDYRAVLISPHGTRVQLFNAVDGGNDWFGERGPLYNNDLVIDPMADFILDDDSVYNFGDPMIFAPFNLTAVHPQENLSAFAGEIPFGEWTLEICNMSPDPVLDPPYPTLMTWLLELEGYNPSQLSLSSQSLSSSQAADEYKSLQVFIANTGDQPLEWSITEATAPESCAEPVDIPWLGTSPVSGTTVSGTDSPIQIEFDSTGISPGELAAAICVSSNDPDAPLVPISVSMIVTDSPDGYQVFLPGLMKRP